MCFSECRNVGTVALIVRVGATMLTIDDYKKWLTSFEALGLPVISTDTSARILATVHSLGNNEQMALCPKLRADLEYIQRVYGIDGGEVPDPEIIQPIREYIAELEKATEVPKWAERLFKERYGIKLYI